ncbi:angiopoietin-1 receptor-like [Patiria miniata]|uniref:Protein kinase domain-containing protein n=1 Tax=Patiria miniata TaxID=46514 RepID=A0A913ZN18_PATMI|nr:angiopoietin-1 receptor-like [Patiria miniata]
MHVSTDPDVVAPGVLGSLLGVTVAAFIVYVVWTRVKQRRHNPGDEAVQPIDEIELTVIGVRMGPEGVDSMVYADTGLPEWASKWEILWSNLVVEEQVLGRGNFGEVKKGTVKKDGKEIQSAIKMLKGQASDRDQKDFMDEFRTMSVIGYHLNVVSLLGACQHQDVLYVALEFLPNGDLHSYLTGLVNSNTAHILTSTKLVKFALDVARGMKHLSDLGVCVSH